MVPDAPVAASVPAASSAVIELEIAGKGRLRIPADHAADTGGGDSEGAGRFMIPVPSQVRIWLAVGPTDMRRGMQGLALQVQETLGRDPHAGDLYVFRGRSGSLIKIIWRDIGLGMSLYAKRLETGRFLWPSPTDGTVFHITGAARLHARRDGLAQPAAALRPERAG